MIGIPYINSLFSSILAESLVMGGRFFITPKLGSEINNNNINDIVTNAMPDAIKWPACLMMPPRKTGNFQFSGEEIQGVAIGYNTYSIQMLFLRPAAYTAYNQPSQPLDGTPIPLHTVQDTWHDMMRCAESFLQELRQVIYYNQINQLVISENNPQSIVMVSDIGNDKVSGVLLNFAILVNGGCDIEDYPFEAWKTIVVPPLTDTHPTHINS